MSTVSDRAVPAGPSARSLPAHAPANQRPSSRRWVRPVQVSAVFIAWLAVLVAASLLAPVPAARPYALFGHLVFLAVSFGSVLAVELHGLAALLRITTPQRLAVVATGLDPLIWGGLVGLAATGVVLTPDLDRPLTVVKLISVLAVAINGLWARDIARALRGLPPGAVGMPRPLLASALLVSAISQVGWWTAVTVGFVTTNA